MTWTLHQGNCVEVMAGMEPESVDAIVCDPPYGLGFLGNEWDTLDGAGGSRPEIGDRETPWTSFGAAGFGAVNPTCATCGGRARGASRCTCEEPEWRHKGEPFEPASPSEVGLRQQLWHLRWAREALRVLKPGAHLVAFGGTRTFHRLACALEDAGFQLRDTLTLEWVYLTGWSKDRNIGIKVDEHLGTPSEICGKRADGRYGSGFSESAKRGLGASADAGGWKGEVGLVRKPSSHQAAQWWDWGQLLKPAHEPIVVARKPLDGTAVENILKHGVGAINIGGCRVGLASDSDKEKGRPQGRASSSEGSGLTQPDAGRDLGRVDFEHVQAGEGRWPPNLLLTHTPFCRPMGSKRVKGSNCKPSHVGAGRDGTHTLGIYGAKKSKVATSHVDDDGMETVEAWDCHPICPVAELDRQSGNRSSALTGRADPNSHHPHPGGRRHRGGGTFAGFNEPTSRVYADDGGASRMFPTFSWEEEDYWPFHYVAKAAPSERHRGLRGRRNPHPTVKPIALMRWLVKLVTPPNGVVLDPFAGSGTTLIAARQLQLRCIGIEKDPDYCDTARRRIEGDMPLFNRLKKEV